MDNLFQATTKQPAPIGGNTLAFLGAGAVTAEPWLDENGKQRVRINAAGGGIKTAVPDGTFPGDVVRLYLVTRPRKYLSNTPEHTVVGRTIEVRAHDRVPLVDDKGHVKAKWIEYYAHRDGSIGEFPWTHGTQTMSIAESVDGHGTVNRLLFGGARYASPEDMLADEAVAAQNRSAWESTQRAKNPALRQAEMTREIATAVSAAVKQVRDEEPRGKRGA